MAKTSMLKTVYLFINVYLMNTEVKDFPVFKGEVFPNNAVSL